MSETLEPYNSFGLTICQSRCHKDMFIIEDGEGGWWNITASIDYILKKYPPNNKVKRVKTYVGKGVFSFDVENVPAFGTTKN